MLNSIHKLYKIFFITNAEKNMMNYFYKNKNKNKNKNKILIQATENPYYYGLFANILSNISKKEDINIDFFIVRSLALGSSKYFSSFVKSVLLYNGFRDKKWIKMYYAFCDNMAYTHSGYLGLKQEFKLLQESFEIFKNIQNKDDVLDIKKNNIIIGDLIYDTYMRYKPSSTVDINDYYLFVVIYQGLKNFHKANKYFEQYKVNLLLVSYSSYIEHGITVRVALDKKIKIYSFGSSENFAKELNISEVFHTSCTSNYKDIFSKLGNKEDKLSSASVSINNKLSGIIEDSYSYMKETSPYKEVVKELPNVKNAVVIFLHDFFDSPHVYESMVFSDFIEWLTFTVEYLEKNSILYYVKSHPASNDDVKKILTEYKKKYNNFNILSNKITNKQLISNGIALGVTVYGTVAHELAYMGVPALTCGNGPHSGFDFCYEATTKDEYKSFLKKYNKLRYSNHGLIKQRVELFYYMYYLHNNSNEKELLKLLNKLRVLSYGEKNICKLIESFDVIKNNNHFKEFVERICS